MFKNIIISILVLSNVVFLVFALYQKQEAGKWAVYAEANYVGRAKMEERVIAALADLALARQTTDSLRNELAKIPK